MNTQERRMIDDAVFNLAHGYLMPALSVLRALQATAAPKGSLTPMLRDRTRCVPTA